MHSCHATKVHKYSHISIYMLWFLLKVKHLKKCVFFNSNFIISRFAENYFFMIIAEFTHFLPFYTTITFGYFIHNVSQILNNAIFCYKVLFYILLNKSFILNFFRNLNLFKSVYSYKLFQKKKFSVHCKI